MTNSQAEEFQACRTIYKTDDGYTFWFRAFDSTWIDDPIPAYADITCDSVIDDNDQILGPMGELGEVIPGQFISESEALKWL